MPKPDPFDQLHAILIQEIPREVKSLKAPGPFAALRIVGYDTSVPDPSVGIMTISEGRRKEIVSRRGNFAPYYLWAFGEDPEDGRAHLPPLRYSPTWKDRLIALRKVNRQLRAVFVEITRQLEDDEERGMAVYCRCLQGVARELNAMDWNQICPVTDDFVVAAAEGRPEGTIIDDLVGSIPADRLELLRRRRFLGPEGEWWQYLPGVSCEILKDVPGHDPFDPESDKYIKAFSNELIQYSPADCREIHCVVTQRAEEFSQVQSYDISYPQFPEQSTTEASGHMDSIAWIILNTWSRGDGAFPGFTTICRMKEQGQWSVSLKRHPKA